MSCAWAIRLPLADAAVLAPLRLVSGLEVAESGDSLWLRGGKADDALQRRLRALPAADRFECVSEDRLRPLNSRIPSARLPPLRWLPLSSWLRVEPPLAALPGNRPRPVALRLVRSTEEEPANLLLTDVGSWKAFAIPAAEVRLRPLRFAVAADQRVLVWGTPLPPLSGGRFVEQAGLAVPVGFKWHPPVALEVLCHLFALSDRSLVVWTSSETFIRLHSEQFVSATRSAVRAAAAEAGPGV